MEDQHPNHKAFNKWFPIVVLAVMGGLIVYSLSGILTVFLGAIIFYVFTRPVMKYLMGRWKFHKILAAALIILVSFVLILGPIIMISNVLVSKLMEGMQDASIHQALISLDAHLERGLGIKFFDEQGIQDAQNQIRGVVTQLVTQSFTVLTNIAIMYFVLYFMLIHVGEGEDFLQSHLPISKENLTMLNHELDKQVYSNVLGIPMLAAFQGFIAGILYYFIGVTDPVFWAVIIGAFAMIPFIGSALVWVPLGLMIMANGELYKGVAVLMSGALIVSTVDNVLRFILLRRMAHVHPLITGLGIFGGIKLFGIAGIIFGPLMLSYFFILLRLYRNSLTIQ